MSQYIKVRILRNKIKKLCFINKKTYAEIAHELKIAPKTVYRHMKFIKEEIKKNLKDEDAENIVLGVVDRNNNLIAKYWELYKKAYSTRNKSICLKNIHKIEVENVSLYEKIGIVEKVAEKLEITGKEELMLLAKAVLDKK